PDFVHTHTAKAGLIGRLAARWTGVPHILHTIHELPQNAARNPLLKWVYATLEKGAARLAHHLVTVSHVNARQILGERICATGDLPASPTGIDLSRSTAAIPAAQLRASWALPREVFVIGPSARLERAKGHVYLLEALPELIRRIPNLYWVNTSSIGVLTAQL